MRAAALPLLTLAALFLAGCADIEEHWTFDEKGGGTYALALSWDADLWRRVRESLGPRAARALTRRAPVPLRASALRETLAGLEGVDVVSLTEGTAPNGRRTLALKLSFRSLSDLWRWSLLARRPMRLSVDGEEGGPRVARLAMEPLRHLMVLDDVIALRARVKRDAAGVLSGPRGLLARWDVDRKRLDLVWDMVKVPLTDTRFRATVEVPGRVRARNEAPTVRHERSAKFAFDWAALQKGPAKRAFSLDWDVSELDLVKPARHRMPPAPKR